MQSQPGRRKRRVEYMRENREICLLVNEIKQEKYLEKRKFNWEDLHNENDNLAARRKY